MIPRIALVLSGGGARGLAHIGVLKVLEREGIEVDLLTGASMGALISSAYAGGMSPAALEQEACRMANARRLVGLVDPSPMRRGLVYGHKVADYISSQLGERTFADLRLPVAIVAVDIESREQVILREGSVVDAIRASTAVPGVFAPVEYGNRLLVDGGVLNNMPVDVAQGMGADVTIAVDVCARFGEGPFSKLGARRYVPTGVAETLDYVWRSLDLMREETQRLNLILCPPDVLIRPNIAGSVTALGGFQRASEIIAAGEQAAQAALPMIRACLQPGQAASEPAYGLAVAAVGAPTGADTDRRAVRESTLSH